MSKLLSCRKYEEHYSRGQPQPQANKLIFRLENSLLDGFGGALGAGRGGRRLTCLRLPSSRFLFRPVQALKPCDYGQA